MKIITFSDLHLEFGVDFTPPEDSDDLCGLGERCSSNRVYRLGKAAEIKAQIGYKRRPAS